MATRIATAMNMDLLHWYGLSGRKLPWRNSTDPYQILISEVMLQQTQVDRVIPAYHRFLDSFPTIRHLATASPRQVIQSWQGLGYYRRAVRLHKLSQIIVSDMNGEIPSNFHELIKLPGIGQYTASAIACFAFSHQIPAIDVNVSRVLHRVFGKQNRSKSSLPSKDFYNLAAQSIPLGSASQWNQALMDVGSIFCKSRSPYCTECPLHNACHHASNASQKSTSATPFVPEHKTRSRIPFRGSSRYFRGRILHALSKLSAWENIAIEELFDDINAEIEQESKLDRQEFHHLLLTMSVEGLIFEIKDNITTDVLAVKLPS